MSSSNLVKRQQFMSLSNFIVCARNMHRKASIDCGSRIRQFDRIRNKYCTTPS